MQKTKSWIQVNPPYAPKCLCVHHTYKKHGFVLMMRWFSNERAVEREKSVIKTTGGLIWNVTSLYSTANMEPQQSVLPVDFPIILSLPYRELSCDVLSSKFCKSSYPRLPCWFLLRTEWYCGTTKCSITFY